MELDPKIAKAARIALLHHRTLLKKCLREYSPSDSRFKVMEQKLIDNEQALNHFYAEQPWQ